MSSANAVNLDKAKIWLLVKVCSNIRFTCNNIYNDFMLSGRISRKSSENIFRSYTGRTSENTDFHVLVAWVNCACLTTRWKYDVIYITFLALDVIL